MEFKFVFRSARRSKDFFLSKDRVSNHLRSSVVYKFTSSSCKATFYGKISRHFIVRCREHLGIDKKGKAIKGGLFSIRDHVSSTGVKLNSFTGITNQYYETSIL